MRYIAIILLSFFTINSTFAESIQFEDKDWQGLLGKAKKENKLIFIDAYTTWCGPCKWMAENVFTDESVGEFFNANFINAKFDMEKGEGIDLAKKYGVNVYPSLLWVNGDGEVVHRMCGAREVDVFLAAGKTAVNEKANYKYYASAASNTSSPEFMYEYIQLLSDACQSIDDIVGDYLDSRSGGDLMREEYFRIIADFGVSYKSSSFKYLITNREQFETAFGEETINQTITDILMWEMTKAIRTYSVNPEVYKNLVADLSQMNFEERDYILGLGASQMALKSKDWDGVYEAGLKLEKYEELVDPQTWNQIAWAMYEQVDNKSKLKAALRWINLALERETNSYMLDTKAALHIKLGNKIEAIYWAEEALKAATEEGQNIDLYEERLAEANNMK